MYTPEDYAQDLTAPKSMAEPLTRTKAQVTAVDLVARTVTLAFAGQDNEVPDIKYSANYVPSLGDFVVVDVNGLGDMKVVDKIGETGTGVFSGFQMGEVFTAEGTTTTTFTNLTTPGPSVAVTVGSSGVLMVGWNAWLTPGSSTDGADMSVALSGANTLSASDGWSLLVYLVSGTLGIGRTYAFRGLTPGPTTVQAKYRSVSGANAQFAGRTVWALPL